MEQLPALSHVSLGTNDFDKAKAFYDAVLAPLGLRCLMDYPGGAGYGRKFPEFWIGLPHDRQRASAGNGVHVCFFAESREQVHEFHAQALRMGGKDDGGPGPRPEYSPGYYAAFACDLDGNKIEAMCWVR